MGAITPSHQKEVANCTGTHRLNDFLCPVQNCVAGETGTYLMSAINACKFLLPVIPAKFQRFFNHRCKILVRANMMQAR